MADESPFPPLPSSRQDIEQLRTWNLEMLDAWYRKKDRFIREYNIICMWGNEVARNPTATGTPLQKKVWELTYSPLAGAPDRRLCQPEAWFMLVEEVKKYLPRNRLRHSYQRLLLIRQDGMNHNFTCGSNKLAMDAQTAVLELFAITEELEDRLVAALNQLSGIATEVDRTVRKERARRAIEAANQRADREAKNKEFELKIEPQHAAQALARVLNMVGETWTTMSPDKITKLDEKAVYWLVAAGMLERQMTLRLRHIGQPTYFEVTINVTGEGGFSEAMQPVHARSYEKWFDAWEKWMESPNAGASPYTTEKLNPGETLRLTDQGMIAHDDIRSGNTKVVIEFALKQGFFADRPPSRGAGVCLEFKELYDGNVTSNAEWLTRSGEDTVVSTKIPASMGTAGADDKAEAGTKSGTDDGLNLDSKRELFLSALNALHHYGDGENFENGPFKGVDVVEATERKLNATDVTRAFKHFFPEGQGGHKIYKVLCLKDAIEPRLRILNRETPDYSAVDPVEMSRNEADY